MAGGGLGDDLLGGVEVAGDEVEVAAFGEVVEGVVRGGSWDGECPVLGSVWGGAVGRAATP